MKSRIAIDMDEVLADTATTHLLRYNLDFAQNLRPEDLLGRSIYDAVHPDHVETTRSYLREDNFFDSPSVMPGSQEVIGELLGRYEIFVATAAMEFPTSFAAKHRWMNRHFPMIPDRNLVFCGDKSILRADFLIDDSPHHFERFKGEGIIFTAPHNVHATGFRRVANWQAVAEMFL